MLLGGNLGKCSRCTFIAMYFAVHKHKMLSNIIVTNIMSNATICFAVYALDYMTAWSSLKAHLRGFQGHFDTPLQHSGREAWAWHGGKPEAEVLVAGVSADALHNALQAGHPADCQVAVLQAHPLPLLHASQQHLLSLHSNPPNSHMQQRATPFTNV